MGGEWTAEGLNLGGESEARETREERRERGRKEREGEQQGGKI